jgi:hypothetical protein
MTDATATTTGILASFYKALGWRVFRIDDVPWCRFGGSTVMTVPLSAVHPVGRAQVARVLRESGCLLAQFPTAAATGLAGVEYVLRDQTYGEAALQRQFRQMLHRGEKALSFRELNWGEVAVAGPRMLDAARARKGITTPVDPNAWRDACEQAEASAEFTVFGCHHGDDLAGIAIFWNRPGGYRAVSIDVHPEFFPLGAANVLLYRSGRALIGRPGCEFVSFGRAGIPEADGQGRFTRHAGLREERLNMAAVLHPRLGWLRRLERSTGALAAARKWLGPASRVADSLAGLAVADATNPSLLPD